MPGPIQREILGSGAVMKYLGLGSVLLAACVFTACEKLKDDDAAEQPAAEAPTNYADHAPSGAHKGEPASPSQPQPVYPDGL